MVKRRTVDLLPEIFRTDTNKKFLSATLDQLTQEPSLKRTQGYVGRRVGPGVNPADNYVKEPTAQRTDYQLEPGVAFLKTNTNTVHDAITYPGMIDALKLAGANTTLEDRLFESQYYSWDPFCDFDKFTNYSQYYWLPEGPLPVDVATTEVPLTDSFTVNRNTNSYTFTDVVGENPPIVLQRGGNYTFDLNQVGHKFWIQAAPGIGGTMPATPNISSRNVLGVINNGEDQGTVEFYVPLKTAQDFYYAMPTVGVASLVTELKFNQLNNIFVDEFLEQYPTGIDGITELDGKTVIFTNTIPSAEDGGWQVTTQYDPLIRTAPNQVGASVSYDVNGEPYDNVPYETVTNIILSGSPDPLDGSAGSFDSLPFDQTTDITSQAQRYSIWLIRYAYDNDGRAYMTLTVQREVPNLSKFSIQYGAVYSSTQWYKNASGYFEQMPLLTAVLDTLWYQDSTNPDIFGQIRLVDPGATAPIDIDEIIGAKQYTAPNGVTFTNGLKVQFRGVTNPPEYQNLEFYVEGVGSGPGVDVRVGFVDGEAYYGTFHVYQGQKMTGSSHTGEFQQYIYDTVAESLINRGRGGPDGAPLPTQPVEKSFRGNGIKLIPTTDFLTPETYTKSELVPYDSTAYDMNNYDASLNAPVVQDYITINRASEDLNPWTRSNRWFHKDVISYSAELNNSTPVIDNAQRAKRPIIEFKPNLRLYNFGTQGKTPVNIIDFNATDAFSNINGQLGYGADGYTFIDGTRVIFAGDLDPAVRNKIYQVRFIDPDNTGEQIIDLVPTSDSNIYIGQAVYSLSGITQQGKSFWYDGATWQLAQQKISVNQAPLFDVYDANGSSLSNRTVYPSSTFAGSQLFGYAVGTGTIVDDALGFPLRFLNINNVGDILFYNYLYNDTFIYVQNGASVDSQVSIGFVRQYVDRVSFSNQIGWETAAAENRSRQVFKFTYANTALVLDVPADLSSVFAPVQVFVDGTFFNPTRYTVAVDDTNTTITFSTAPSTGATVEVQVISNVASTVGYYQVPLNLESNAINTNSTQFTLGTIRNHYETIGQNLRNIVGPIIGANNTRDLGNIVPYGTQIVQNSAPLTLTGTFLRQRQYEVFSAIEFNSQEYTKYKTLLVDLAGKGDFVNLTPSQVLDTVIQEITVAKNEQFPFYWSDMLPSGEVYTENSYTVSQISGNTFDTVQTYDFTQSNFKALLVYVNNTLLTYGYDYTVPVDTSTVIISSPLSVGDVVKIREYTSTVGNFVPNTPTKMGMYPAFKPEIYLDNTYVDPALVIRGHDGSITVAFGDFRDQVLLEFETRIFNNLKIKSVIPLNAYEVIPGQFRDTDFSLAEINEMLGLDFLNWIGWNKLDYANQTYIPNNEFTYNYAQSGNKLTGQPLLGAWRGIYNYFYDTISPNTTPWEMLGFSQQPDWWEAQYGPAPYTSGNMVLWGDLERGYIADPLDPRINPQFIRPLLTNVIPAGTEGELLGPLDSTVGNYDATSFRRSWVFGDDGPVESSWRTSSSWPFAVMRLLALTKPAKFFSLFVDRDRYVYNASLNQYLWDERYRINPTDVTPLYGNGTSKASYINWIIDYNRQLGVDSTQQLATDLANLDIRLCWRVAGFTDKKYLNIYTERSTPGGSNTSLLLPDESYQLLLYKNQPFENLIYSSVVVQSTSDGWAVSGYGTLVSYFEILSSKPLGKTITISAGGTSVQASIEYSENIVRVPYGYVFTNREAVCDFLLSYGKLMEQRGMSFETTENGYIMNWFQMSQEFLYWSNQGWAPGSIINLNPAAVDFTVAQPLSVVDSLVPPRPDSMILNQTRLAIQPNNLVINRLDNVFNIKSLTSDTINFTNLRFTNFEHLIVLDNRSIFADLIYDPATAARQSRVLISGWLTAEWNGLVDAPGFVLNQDNIQEWRSNVKYTKGEIVLFKNEYWVASTIIQPAEQFNYNLWVKSDYDQVQKGLLPNAANASDQLQQAYSVYNANLEENVDLFSFGLIGFRPREYMKALNLDDISQVNLYQQFLGSKGTLRSAEIFTFANLGKEVAQYDIYEYWAMLRSQYGANANRSYFELLLNQALLPSDPALIQVIQPGEESRADQKVFVDNIWKSSYKITTPNIFPTTNVVLPDVSLPNAGYVSLDDVDVTVFDIEDPTSLTTQLDQIGIGTIIWAAKSNAYDWNIYRTQKVNGQINEVADNLDGLSQVTFDAEHELVPGNLLIIKEFSAEVNGVYRVQAVPSPTQVTIVYTFTGFQTTVTGTGLGLTLKTARVAQPADIQLLPYSFTLPAGLEVWVDNNGFGQWEVLEKTDPFTQLSNFSQLNPTAYSRFGSAVGQGLNNLTAFVGSPGYSVGGEDSALTFPGAVYTYIKTDSDVYAPGIQLILNSPEAAGFGNAIEVGRQSWAIIGASRSRGLEGYAQVVYVQPGGGAIEQRQVLVNPAQTVGAGEFGHSVTMSSDEHWLYIGAPGLNEVFAYTREDVQRQSVEYITNGSTTNYNWSDYIAIDPTYPDQLAVSLNGIALTAGADFVVTATSVALNSPPPADRLLTISRRLGVQLDQRLSENVSATTTIGIGSGAVFTVNNVRGLYTVQLISGGADYVVGDLLTISQDDVCTDVLPPSPINTTYVSAIGSTITLNSNTDIVAGMTVAGTGFTSGQYVLATAGATDVILSASPDSTPSGTLTFSHDIKVVVTAVNGGSIVGINVSGAGVENTAVFDLNEYFATVDSIFSFTVVVNNITYRPFIDFTYNSGVVTFVTVPPAGAVMLVNADSYFTYVAALPTPTMAADAKFGHSITTTTDGSIVAVGAPNINNSKGQAYLFARHQQNFVISSTTETQFTTVESLASPGTPTVKLNDNYLIPTQYNINGQYEITSANTLTVLVPLAVGDILTVSTNQFTLLQVIESDMPINDAQFGYAMDQCINDCSLYVGAPFDSNYLIEGGRVEFSQNQSRVFGVITSSIANPTLTPGESIRLNNIYVNNTGTTVASLVDDINTASIANVRATLVPDLEFEGDSSTKIFSVGTIYSAAESYTPVVYVNNVLQTLGSDYTYNNSTEQIIFVTAPFNTARIVVVAGRITISVVNYEASPPTNRLNVLPGTGTLFDDIGFEVYTWIQTVVAPVVQNYAHFGQSVSIANTATTLLVGAPNGTSITPTTFDNGETRFDDTSTTFFDATVQSGAVYTYDMLGTVNPSLASPSKFVFGQQILSSSIQALDQFGTAIDYTTGIMIAGAPGSDLGDSSQADFGQVVQYRNVENLPAWQPKRIQVPLVNTALLNTMFMYDRISGASKEFFDFFDPLQGKLLGVVRENLDFIGSIDPANYNIGDVNNFGLRWGQEHVGQIWWDTTQSRFIDPHQDDIAYASRRWGQLFPGSTVEIYQWTVSTTPPAEYTGPGTPKSTSSYAMTTTLNEQGFIQTQYYFWITDVVDISQGKTLSVNSLTSYIENPRSSGIPYVAPINASTVAIYNGLQYISAEDTVIHMEFDQKATEAAVHLEYQLIPQDRADGFLSDGLYQKMLDSFTGSTVFGNPVPDPFLSPSEKYGVQVRPRQTLFANRFLALENYLERSNEVLAQFPISETRSFNLLNSSEPEPNQASGAWDSRVLNQEELSYQNLQEVPIGYKYLVVNDSNNNGLWTIYQTVAGRLPGEINLGLVRVQNYDTRLYWSFVDWYMPGYSQFTKALLEVPNVSALETITVPEGSSVRVTANAQGKWEIYLRKNSIWTRVALQDGTIAFSAKLWDYAVGKFGFDSEVFDAQYFDQTPTIETRKILESINTELMIDDLLIERNRLLVLMFNYIMSEQQAPTWLTKTSLIDVDHNIRELLPYQVYRRDNQDFVLNYINEVKPYHVQIREFNLRYNGMDTYQGSLTDFDLPAYWDAAQGIFVSPVLDENGNLSTTSSVTSADPLWQTFPYNQWFQNYNLSLESVTVVNGGSGYLVPPEVVITGASVTPAEMIARINSAGVVTEIIVVNPGSGYVTTPVIELVSESGGHGARAVPIMGNSMVRQLTTVMKYDRYQYHSTILPWVANQSYDNGEMVRYANRVWAANSSDSSGVRTSTFDPADWTLVPAGDLSGVDRTMGFYTPTPNQPGLDLAQLISGVDYPGVQVMAPGFDRDTGFDVGGFDVNPFDNIFISVEGQVSYDPAILDAIYGSSFVDPYLGVGPSAIDVVGGAFVDEYSSHAPEELVPGIGFDTLDMRVFTTPGSDWDSNGHGFPIQQRNYAFDPATPVLDFAGLLDYAYTIQVFNYTQGLLLDLGTDYEVDWANYTVEIIQRAVSDDVISISAVALGGGNQLYVNSYVGTDVVANSLVVPIEEAIVEYFVVYVNGQQVTNYTFGVAGPGATRITFASGFGANDRITLTAMGVTTNSSISGWSLPVTQYIIADGSLAYALTNNLGGTNPANMIVTVDGNRARPSEGIEYVSDGSGLDYGLPVNGGYSQAVVADNDVAVWVNNTRKILGVDYFVSPPNGTNQRYVQFASTPAIDSKILISVRTVAQYWINGNTLTFQPAAGLNPAAGSIVAVTTWNDTVEQNLLTQVFVGPTTQGIVVTEGYDVTLFDEGNISGDPGSFAYSAGVQIQTNRFDTGRIITNTNRLVVTLNGVFLQHDQNYVIDGSIVEILGPIINAADVVAITSMTNSTVPGAIAFRIFQDMRGLQSTYRITVNTTTELVAPLLATDDVIYVRDASNLSQPNLSAGYFGLITINGERISYRNRDTVANTVSGLRRGTAGTGAANHAVRAPVYDIGRSNLLSPEYQNQIVQDTFLGNGVTKDFTAENVNIYGIDSTALIEAVEVYVGGIKQQGGYSIIGDSPVIVRFDTAPLQGYQVAVRVVQAQSWYEPGSGTPSNGIALQEQQTEAARFIRGD
jgi:hypothetical protein